MTTVTEIDTGVIGGIDTHKDFHVVVVIDTLGRILDTAEFPATPAGYRSLLRWMRKRGNVVRVGVEGTGAYGAGIARFLTQQQVDVIEVDRPNRQFRRRRGKSDPVDAEAAARAALSGEATGTPKSRNGSIEAIRVLRVARRSALKARTQAANQIHAVVLTAPEDLRARLEPLPLVDLVAAASRLRTCGDDACINATKTALRSLAKRWQHLTAEIAALDNQLDDLVAATAPNLVERRGLGTDTAGALLVTAGDNPQRLHSEASFAALCGVSPVAASSGNHQRHRLNRGGDRDANNALWRIALVRMATCDKTRAYVTRRTAQGRTKKEIIRCLKRYIAREIYPDLLDLHQ